MGTVNKTTKKSVKHRRADAEHAATRKDKAHANWMGGPSYFLNDPVNTLRIAAASCFFGEPQYYHRDKADKRPSRKQPRHRREANLSDAQLRHLRETLESVDPQDWRGKNPTELMIDAIDKALDHDIDRTLQLAVELRQVHNIRVTPQVILVRAAHHKDAKGTGLVRRYAKDIVHRLDEPCTGLAYQLGAFGRKAIPNSLKKAWADRLERADEYQLAKYRMDGHEVKLVDVVNICHAASDAVDKLHNDKLRTTGLTWEAIISEKGSTEAAWNEALEVMGHMALLRNIRNLLEKGLEPKQFCAKLIEGVEYGRQLPFRYYSAYNAVKGNAPGSVLDAIEIAMEKSLGNLPQLEGRVMALCDNSGSATSTCTSKMGTMAVNQIANLTAVVTGKISDEGYIGVFGDRLKAMPIRKKSSIFEQASEADRAGNNVGGGTENGIWLFWDKAIKQKEHWDHVFVYSDMQAGHGGLYGCDASEYSDYIWPGSGHYIDVPMLINEYRNKVNPNVFVYLVQVAGYQDTLIPEFYDRTFILGGWSGEVIRFADDMRRVWEQGAAQAK